MTDNKKIVLPLKKGDVVGKISVLDNNKVVATQDLVATKNVDKLNFFQLFMKNITKISSGIL